MIIPTVGYSQNDLFIKIDSFKVIREMGYICEGSFTIGQPGCGDKLFWNVVQMKERAMMSLINKLDDTTKSKAFVANFGGYWTVADISYAALQEIIQGIPTFELLPIEFDENGCGYCSYWQYLRENSEHRLNFKMNVLNWFNNNKDNLIWVADNRFSSCDCSGQHPNNGHYEVKK